MTEQLHFHFSLSCIGEGNGNPLQCSCLENPRDGGAWWAAVSGVIQSRTRLKRLSSSSSSSLPVVAYPGGLVVKNLPANAGDTSDAGWSLVPGLGRLPGGGHSNPLQCSFLENPMDRGAWLTVVCGLTKSQTLLSTHTHAHTNTPLYV